MNKLNLEGLNVLIWDIETSLMLLSKFNLYEERISHENIEQDWNIICGSFKQAGSKEVHHVHVTKNLTCDKTVAAKLAKAIESADILVHHNGDKFDLKKLNARLYLNNLPPLPNKITTVDTLKLARKYFAFTSNRLDYLAKAIGIPGKIKSKTNLWQRILRGDKTAVREMVKYCDYDVVMLEKVFYRMAPFCDLPNFDDIRRKKDLKNKKDITGGKCPQCLSSKIIFRGKTKATSATAQRQLSCNSCGHWFVEKRIVYGKR